MELLTIVFQVIVPLIESLFEFDELLSLLGNLVVVAISHVKLLVLNTFTLLRQNRIEVLFEVFSVFSLENLRVRQFHQSLLLTVNQKISRLLKCN